MTHDSRNTPEPSADQLRQIAFEARQQSFSASDDAAPVQYVLAGWKAATERAATKATSLATDAAIKYANGYPVDFEKEVGDAIRGMK